MHGTRVCCESGILAFVDLENTYDTMLWHVADVESV